MILQTRTAEAPPAETPVETDVPVDAVEAMQWTAYLQQMTAVLNGAVSWMAGLSVGYFAIVVLALLGVILLVLHFARRYVPMQVFETVETLAKETVTAVREISEKRLEDAKSTATPLDDAIFQITSTLANLVLALANPPVSATPAILAAGRTDEIAALQKKVADLQSYSIEALRTSDEMAADRAREKYGATPPALG